MTQKIIITGHSHCGTTILKCITGHIKGVYECPSETETAPDSGTPYSLCKCPHLKEKFFGFSYKDYIKILIVRNPLWVYSSLNRRSNKKIHYLDSESNYTKTCFWYNYFKENPDPNVHILRYEDMFENNHQKLREIFDKIGFEYSDEIFDNSKFKNIRMEGQTCVPTSIPGDRNHEEHRMYQINQPFVNNNTLDKLEYTQDQWDLFTNDSNVLMIYPELGSLPYRFEKTQ